MPPQPALASNRAGETLCGIAPKTLKALCPWLAKSRTQAESVWVVFTRKAAGGAFAASDITDEALCLGWNDSLPRRLDETHTMIINSPRKAKSGWSEVNTKKIARLMAAGRMAPAGLAAIAAAKASGAWEKLASVDALEEPVDLLTTMKANPPAFAHWQAFSPSTRRGILEWILNAKRPETRAKRIAETARLAADNKRANQWQS